MGERKIKPIDFEISNIQKINDRFSECLIKVFYHGQNRNGSYISKPVGDQIAKTLPRTPIVALYNEEIEDYEGHGEEMIINDKGVKFERKTIPFGAVDSNTELRWEEVTDENGNIKEYMVVSGYLWTGRYPHLQSVIKESKGQSMEFFEDSVEGDWALFDNSESETFVINDAVISALCILGDEVEPCFEDASIGSASNMFSLDKKEFKREFEELMYELDESFEKKEEIEGGEKMKNEKFEVDAVAAVEKAEKSKMKVDVDAARKLVNALEDEDKKEKLIERLDKIEVKEDDDKKDEKEEKDEYEKAFDLVEVAKTSGKEEDFEVAVNFIETLEDGQEKENLSKKINYAKELKAHEDLKAKFEALKIKHDDVEVKYTKALEELENLKINFSELNEERKERELQDKEAICEKFAVLGEDVLKPFKENFDDYSVEELEKEFSVIAFNKGITFELLENSEDTIITNFTKTEKKEVPAWAEAIKNKESAEY